MNERLVAISPAGKPVHAPRHGAKRAKFGVVLSAALLAAAGFSALAATGAAGAAKHSQGHGVFRETAAGAGLGYNLAGSAKMTIGEDWTTLKVNVSGLDPVKTYGSHLHNGTCADGGGGHYQDVEGGATTPPNELWLSSSSDPLGGLKPNPGGSAHGVGTAAWAARTSSTTHTNARSIVVHEPGGTRIACADLR